MAVHLAVRDVQISKLKKKVLKLFSMEKHFVSRCK